MRDPLNFSKHLLNKPAYNVLFVCVILLTIFFRLWKLPQVPPGMFSDEAINASQGITALEEGKFTVFFKENFGRESLYIYLVGASAKIFGETKIWAARLPSVGFGILGVAGLYFLAKALTNKDVALLAAFFMAVDLWHVNFSRIGFRAIIMPAFLGFSLYLLIRSIRTGKLVWYLLGGFVYGLGFYSYISYRISPVLILIAILIFTRETFNQREQITSEFRNRTYLGIFLFTLTSIVMALPLGIYFLNNPEDFWHRISKVSISSGNSSSSPLVTLLTALWKTLGIFNISGDPIERHNLQGEPQLYWLIGLFFIAGIAFMLYFLFYGWKNKDRPKIDLSVFLLSYLGLMLIPTILSQDNLHAIRTLCATTPAYLLSGVGCYFMLSFINKFYKETSIEKYITPLIITILFIGISVAEYDRYFVQWANEEEVKRAFTYEAVLVANSLDEFTENANLYITADNISDYRNTIYYLSGRNDEINFVSFRNFPNKDIDPSELIYIIPVNYFNRTQERLEKLLGFPLFHHKTASGIHYFTTLK